MGDYYNITKAKGGKDDFAIERGLLNKIDELRGGSEIEINIDRYSPREGKDRVDIHTNSVYFFDKKDYTHSPVAIQAAARILHKHGFRGYYRIEVSGNVVAIQHFWTEKERKISTKEPSKYKEISSGNIDDTSLWNFALANPSPLFLALENDSMVALFDKNSFFLSHEATKIYEKIKSKPHIYSARLESGNKIYIGISNQSGGRWQPFHAYHLGCLAHEILGTTRHDDQNHSHWVESWFEIENFKKKYIDSKYHIRMRDKVIISFFVPEPHATKEELKILESRLISIARGKGLNVLNIMGGRKDKKLINEMPREGKSLFIIPCCSTKLSGGNRRLWNEVRLNQESNKFKFLDHYRLQMIDFYSGLSQENALNYYENRGSGEDRIRKVLKAWQKNLKIHEGKTMMAIDRYNGNLYKALNFSLGRQLRGCELDNVLIISALMGIIAPTDLIPDYELMMMDRSPDNKKVWQFWKDTFENEEVKQSLQNIFSKYDYIYCLMSTSTGYIKSVSELLFDHKAYKIISQEIGQTNILKSWGRVLSEVLLKRSSSLDGVKRVAEIHNCVLTEL